MRRYLAVAVVAMLFVATLLGERTEAAGGAVPIRLTDGVGNRCINPQKDMVWLTLRRVITEKKGTWLTENKSVESIFKAQVSAPGKPSAFPLSAETQLGSFSKGQVSVPIEYTIVD